MSSKFNCFKNQTNFDHTKETKLQKYLKERNEQLLEKCFNIKVEKSKKEQQHSNNDKLPQQPINKETDQELGNNISVIITNSLEKDLQQSETEEVKNSTLSSQNMDPTTSAKSNKQRPQTAPNRSINSTCLKPSKNNRSQSARSPVSTNWKSPFTSFTTKGTRSLLHPQSQKVASEFAYDLSRDELKFAGKFSRPMKPLPEAECQLLKNGQRKDYLMQRYEHSPVVKYNYPEATSWRIGWLQQKQ